jgi:SHS2 domain-containing protein
MSIIKKPLFRSKQPHWEHFHHGADIGVRGIASSKAEAYAQAAMAMTGVMLKPETVNRIDTVEIDCEAPDAEILLVDWLNAIIYEMSTRKMIFGEYKVELSGNRLHGIAMGERVEPKRHQPAVEIKGATFTELKVGQDSEGWWIAQCVVDV